MRFFGIEFGGKSEKAPGSIDSDMFKDDLVKGVGTEGGGSSRHQGSRDIYAERSREGLRDRILKTMAEIQEEDYHEKVADEENQLRIEFLDLVKAITQAPDDKEYSDRVEMLQAFVNRNQHVEFIRRNGERFLHALGAIEPEIHGYEVTSETY